MVRKTALAPIGPLFVASTAFAGSINDQQTMKALHAVSADFGERHFVSFFATAEGRCSLTVASASKMDENAKTAPDDIQRLRLVVNPANFARIETPNRGALQFACSTDATRMTMTVLHELANN